MFGKKRTKIWVVALSNNYEASLPYRLSTYRFCKNAKCVILQNWEGWISKLEELSKFLSGNCDDADLVVFSDAHDFVFIKDIGHIAEDFFGSDKDIIFGAEKRCAHHSPEAKIAFESTSDSEFRYLNSGMIIATAKIFRRALKMILPYDDRTVVDQTLWGNLFAARRPDLRIGLDYERKFVHTANSITSEDPAPATPYAIHVTWQDNKTQAEKFSRVLRRHSLVMEQNRQCFSEKETVEDYEKREDLYAAEEEFLAQDASVRKSDAMNNPIGGGPQRISVDEALSIIKSEGLLTVLGSWHYSWNLKQFYDELFVYRSQGRTYVFHDTPIHEWAPAPLFSNDETLQTLIGKKGKGCPFWFLKLNGFEDFLQRRSNISRYPKKHFPSLRTYAQCSRKLKCRLERYNLFEHEELFKSWYSQLKDPWYNHSGEECIAGLLRDNARVPRNWFIFFALVEEESGEYKSVAVMADDGRSCSVINIASERRGGFGYGNFLHVEVIKHLCHENYYSFDAGVSAHYGDYKQKIFLDVLPVDFSGSLPFLSDPLGICQKTMTRQSNTNGQATANNLEAADGSQRSVLTASSKVCKLSKSENLNMPDSAACSKDISHQKPQVLLLADNPGWAYDSTAQAIKRHLSDEFEFHIEYVCNKPDLSKLPFDLIYVFFWGETYHQSFVREPHRVIKGIGSHRWALEEAYGCLSASEAAEKYLADAAMVAPVSKKLFSIFSPYHDALLTPVGFEPEVFFPYDRRSGEMCIGWAGYLPDPCKGIKDIIQPAVGSDFTIKIAGGELGPQEMRDFYNSVDVICVASTTEGNPFPLIEAMACGCFPVCVDVGIVPELMRHRDNGLIINRSIPSFRAAFQWCKTNLTFIREAGRRNAVEMRDTRTWDYVAPYWRNALRKALQGRRADEGEGVSHGLQQESTGNGKRG